MPTYSTGVIAAGLFLFGVVLAWHIVLLAYALVRRVDKPLSPQSFFNYTVIIFATLRIAHIATANAEGWAPFYLNRLALLVFMTALSITLYTWMAALGIVLAADAGLVSEVRGMLDKLQWIFLVVNVVIYIMMIITIAMYVSTDREGTRNPWFEASIILMAFIIFVMGVLFVVQSWRLYTQAEKSSAHVHTVLLRASICSMLVAVAFLLRVVMLLYRPASGGKRINDDAFFVISWYLPELIPLAVSLIVHTFRITSSGGGDGDGNGEYHKVDGERRGGGGFGPRGTSESGTRAGGGGASSSVRGVAGSSSGRSIAHSTDGETVPDYDMPPDDRL